MSEAKNTVTLLTPPGVGAIAVVRVRGPSAVNVLQSHFARKLPQVSRLAHGDFKVDGRVLDDIVVARIADDVFDLNFHGGDWIVRSAIAFFEREGFARTEESPDPEDSLLQQEVFSGYRFATTAEGLRLLNAQESLWEQMKREAASGKDVRAALLEALQNRTLERLLHPPSVAIVGPANVGKSTLANQLFGTQRSITADVPGTTRDWVGELANVNGLPVMLLDTPGIRPTSDEIEHAAIRASSKQIERAELIVLVLDATRMVAEQLQTIREVSALLPPQVLGGKRAELATARERAGVGAIVQESRAFSNLEKEPPPYPSPPVPGERIEGESLVILVVNKSDRAAAEGIAEVRGIRTVATTGQGVDQLREAIVQHFCGSDTIRIDRPSVWTERQRRIVERAMSDVNALIEL